MAFFKRKQKHEADPMTPETRDELHTRLAQIEEELAMIGLEQEDSFRRRMSGDKHDGNHNRDSDWWIIRQGMLNSEKEKLIARIERIQAGLATIALSEPTETQ